MSIGIRQGSPPGTLAKITETTLAATANTVSLTIPAGYKWLMLKADIKGEAVFTGNIVMTLNSDAGANYYYEALHSIVAVITAAYTGSAGNFILAPVYDSGSCHLDIEFSDKDTFTKKMMCRATNNNPGTPTQSIHIVQGTWNNTANQITTITIANDNARNMSIGTKFSVYGIAV